MTTVQDLDLDGSPFVRSARAYWKAGWTNPLPVRGKDGPPRGYTGWDGRQVSYPDLQAWLDEAADTNVGLRLQRGLIGIDVDAYDDKGGDRTLDEAQAVLGALPATWSSTSRGLGRSRIHLFRVPLELSLRGAEGRFRRRFGDHVEIIHFGHRYVVASPSVHPGHGGIYTWYDPTGIPTMGVPLVGDLTDLPAEWIAFLSEPEVVAEVQSVPLSDRKFTQEQADAYCLRYAIEPLRSAPHGTINNALNEAAVVIGHFVPTFYSEVEVTKVLLEAQLRPEHNSDDWTARATIASGLSRGKAEPYAMQETRLPSLEYVAPTPAAVFDDEGSGDEDAAFMAMVLGGQVTPDTAMDSTPQPFIDPADRLLAEMFDRDTLQSIPEPDPLIEGFLDLNTTVRVNGPSGNGKSFVVLDMAAHIAQGKSWHGNQVVQGKVLYLVAEGHTGILRRVRAWEQHHGTRMDNVAFLTRPVQVNDAEWAVMIEACRRMGPSLIILDTQARVTVGMDENSAQEMGELIHRVDALRDATGACVMLVHHTGHEGGRGRGSSAALGAMHSEFLVTKDDKGVVTFKTAKQKDREQADDLKFQLQGVQSPDGSPGSAVITPYGAREEGQDERYTAQDTRLLWVMQLLGEAGKAEIRDAYAADGAGPFVPKRGRAVCDAAILRALERGVIQETDRRTRSGQGHTLVVVPERDRMAH